MSFYATAIISSLLQFQNKNKHQTCICTNKVKKRYFFLQSKKKVLIDVLKSTYFTLFRNTNHKAKVIQARHLLIKYTFHGRTTSSCTLKGFSTL